MNRTQADFYANPSIYDILHAPGTAREVDGLERMAARFGPAGRAAWLEPACGSGRYLRVACGRGRRVIGFDISQAMVDYARRSLAGTCSARVFTAGMVDFAGPLGRERPGFAFNTNNTIRHLGSDQDMLAHLDQVARVLRPGGVYAIGITLSAYGRERPAEDVWSGARGRCQVVQVVQYLPPETKSQVRARRERVISHLSITRPSGTTHVDSTYHLRCYDQRQWHALVGRSPMRIAAVVDPLGFDAVELEPGYQYYMLRATRSRSPD